MLQGTETSKVRRAERSETIVFPLGQAVLHKASVSSLGLTGLTLRYLTCR